MFTEIVKRALVETVTDIGQLTAVERRELNAAVKRGHLSRGKGGPYPILKTVWAHPGFDFAADRREYVREAMALAEADRQAVEARKARRDKETDAQRGQNALSVDSTQMEKGTDGN